MSDKSPVGGILGSAGLLLLAVALLVIGIRGLMTIDDNGKIQVGSLTLDKGTLILFVIFGIGSAIAGVALFVVTVKK